MSNHPEMTQREIEKEREANYFAMELLMPEEFLRKDVTDMYPNGLDLESTDAVKRLAEKYEVSEQIMTIRLTELYFGDMR
jgi:Zn-dependent peptidase ImmA (M78 family)